MIDGVHSIAWHAAVLRAECENCRHRRSTLKGHASRTFERHVLHEVLNPRPHAVELGRTLIDLKMAVRINLLVIVSPVRFWHDINVKALLLRAGMHPATSRALATRGLRA